MLEINYFTEMILARPLSFGLVCWILTSIFLWWEHRGETTEEEYKKAIKLQNQPYNQKGIETLKKQLADAETRNITLQEHLVVLERKSKQTVDYDNINKIAKLESQIRSLNRKLTNEELEFEDVYDGSFWEERTDKNTKDFFRECAMRDFKEYRKELRHRNFQKHITDIRLEEEKKQKREDYWRR